MKKGVIVGVRYFLAISLLSLSIYWLGKETGWCDAWQVSSKISFFAILILSALCAGGEAEKYDDSIVAARWFGKCMLILGSICVAVQGIIFLPWQYAVVGMLFIPVMWLLIPRVYPI